MVTKTIKTLSLCVLVLGSVSIQAGLQETLAKLPNAVKSLYKKADAKQPVVTNGALAVAGGLSLWYSEQIVLGLGKALQKLAYPSAVKATSKEALNPHLLSNTLMYLRGLVSNYGLVLGKSVAAGGTLAAYKGLSKLVQLYYGK